MRHRTSVSIFCSYCCRCFLLPPVSFRDAIPLWLELWFLVSCAIAAAAVPAAVPVVVPAAVASPITSAPVATTMLTCAAQVLLLRRDFDHSPNSQYAAAISLLPVAPRSPPDGLALARAVSSCMRVSEAGFASYVCGGEACAMNKE